MKRIGILLIGALLLACEGQFPPEICADIADQEVFIRESKVVNLCIEDADGQELTVAFTSSNEAVVTTEGGSDELVTIRGHSVGEAVITVIATDPDERTVEALFLVKVPNRAPDAIAAVLRRSCLVRVRQRLRLI